MILRKLALCSCLLFTVLTGSFTANAQKGQPLLKKHPGVVSYTYRKSFAKDMPGTLDIVKKNGFTDIEFSSLFGQTAQDIRKMIDERGIKCSSFGVGYEDLTGKTDEVAKNAKILGAQYVRVAGFPHSKTGLTPDEAKQAVSEFNRVGKILKDQYGLTLIYHNHGFEFQPYENGTLFDYIVQHTNPRYVSLEMDILWVFFPGQDPVALLKKYGNRFKAMHVKDLKKGVEGNLSGGTSGENDVAVGTGQLNIPAILKAAKKSAIMHYYIEDESSNVETQVPQSVQYLLALKE
ncbi:MAG TPA: sugar phosphate isomerase/epimerase [Chitinophaga sp.]|uniref:sugar phosphate isomerase/epimerase family protein n=1 Tax=Chitinophaga sp. TaxID=1869181 RepID=UPI002DB85345|nr:sugar phosphate isomerase/epimerase [Chitinophaga sp.]HEU4552027.1 sugar phosphate isomerase/epimerase [Chitinophaga sp.]